MKTKQLQNSDIFKKLMNLVYYVNFHISTINESKVFAAIILIVLNITPKFVEINLSKSMESYLRYTLSRDILIFAIVWSGTRDIIMSIIIALLFKICFDYLLNENSMFCCLSENFTNYYISRFNNETFSNINKKNIDNL
jgi:hypothetical protein